MYLHRILTAIPCTVRELEEVQQLGSVHGAQTGVVLADDSVGNIQLKLL